MNEAMGITIAAIVLSVACYLFIYQKLTAEWRKTGMSNLVVTVSLLFYYNNYIYDPSHGIGILLVPMVTSWIAWRSEATGKPGITPAKLIAFQIAFALLFVLIVTLQEA